MGFFPKKCALINFRLVHKIESAPQDRISIDLLLSRTIKDMPTTEIFSKGSYVMIFRNNRTPMFMIDVKF